MDYYLLVKNCAEERKRDFSLDKNHAPPTETLPRLVLSENNTLYKKLLQKAM